MTEELREKLAKVIYDAYVRGEFSDSEMLAMLAMLENNRDNNGVLK